MDESNPRVESFPGKRHDVADFDRSTGEFATTPRQHCSYRQLHLAFDSSRRRNAVAGGSCKGSQTADGRRDATKIASRVANAFFPSKVLALENLSQADRKSTRLN